MLTTTALENLNILPFDAMQRLTTHNAKHYQRAMPFPHIVVDDFFDPALLDKVLAEFPAPEALHWKRFQAPQEIKLASKEEQGLGFITRLLIYHLNAAPFLHFLSMLTGIENIIADPYLEGGGLHQIKSGGKLGIHADFNKHKRCQLDRRLNLLLYLNKEWDESYGGHLELWDREMTACQQRILPIFNRVVIFSTTDFTYHGHPNPLTCPADRTRKSLALYYYTHGRPASEVNEKHNTLFKARPNEQWANKKESFVAKLKKKWRQ